MKRVFMHIISAGNGGFSVSVAVFGVGQLRLKDQLSQHCRIKQAGVGEYVTSAANRWACDIFLYQTARG